MKRTSKRTSKYSRKKRRKLKTFKKKTNHRYRRMTRRKKTRKGGTLPLPDDFSPRGLAKQLSDGQSVAEEAARRSAALIRLQGFFQDETKRMDLKRSRDHDRNRGIREAEEKYERALASGATYDGWKSGLTDHWDAAGARLNTSAHHAAHKYLHPRFLEKSAEDVKKKIVERAVKERMIETGVPEEEVQAEMARMQMTNFFEEENKKYDELPEFTKKAFRARFPMSAASAHQAYGHQESNKGAPPMTREGSTLISPDVSRSSSSDDLNP